MEEGREFQVFMYDLSSCRVLCIHGMAPILTLTLILTLTEVGMFMYSAVGLCWRKDRRPSVMAYNDNDNDNDLMLVATIVTSNIAIFSNIKISVSSRF